MTLSVVILLSAALLGQSAQESPSAELRRLFDADQADRSTGVADWRPVSQRDEARRRRVLDILDRSAATLKAADFYHAAMVFHHGDSPNDYLLAHTLAVLAAANGHQDSAFLSAAALDRYLDSIGQPQIFGSQFHKPGEQKPWTQEPYNPELLSDFIRQAFGIPTLAKQREHLGELNKDAPEARR